MALRRAFVLIQVGSLRSPKPSARLYKIEQQKRRNCPTRGKGRTH